VKLVPRVAANLSDPPPTLSDSTRIKIFFSIEITNQFYYLIMI
jgi:hypothetical protein